MCEALPFVFLPRKLNSLSNATKGTRPFTTLTNTSPHKLYLAADHGGVDLKATLLNWAKAQGVDCIDLGTSAKTAVDYPTYATKLADTLKQDSAAFGLLICRTGIGMSMAANRHAHIRAAVCDGAITAGHTRRDNNANVLCLGADTTAPANAIAALEVFLTTDFLGNAPDGERHRRRVAQFSQVSQHHQQEVRG